MDETVFKPIREAMLLSMVTIEGASSMRMEDLTGSLQTGKAADMVVLDGDCPHFMSMPTLSSELVRYGTRGEVLQTIVAGRLLYDHGSFPSLDLDTLAAEARAGGCFVRNLVEDRRYRPLSEF